MEQILICNRRSLLKKERRSIRLKLVDGVKDSDNPHRKFTLYHDTGILADRSELEGNQTVKDGIGAHILAMCKAYTLMQMRHMDIDNRLFEKVVRSIIDGQAVDDEEAFVRESLYDRFVRYIEEAHRDGVMGEYRYVQMLGKARKLQRFLLIRGLPEIGASDFDINLLLDFRQFISDEYLYVTQYPQLYPRGGGRRPPKKRCGNNTVVHDLKALKAFFNELENSGEVERSPFRKLSGEKRRSIMHVMYDDPFFLRADELHHLIDTPVPARLQTAKDIFVLNCALGCRIGDLLRLNMDKVAVSTEGIPYVHYIPRKTVGSQRTNREIQTPLIHIAWDIVQRTQLSFRCRKQQYNKLLRRLLDYCQINRRISLYDPEKGDNIYLPLCHVASSKLARKTHIDILNKVQINYYAAGLHRAGSEAVFRYTTLELPDRFALLNAAFGEQDYRVEQKRKA